ncbi:MAG TPA: TetR family transcriptional regulator [Burkholderiales bacterium]
MLNYRRRARRGPGRPTGAGAAQLRGRILEAAATEFARSGLGGARVGRIAAQAGVNVRMLYYYFGSKDDLFLAVLEHAYATIREAEKGLELEQGDPEEAMRRLVRFTWGYYFSHPEFITLLNSENLHQGRHVRRSGRIAELHTPFLEMIGRLLERGARAGVFRDDVDPMQLYISIAGLGYFYLSNRYTLSAIFKRDLMTRARCDARLAHMTDVVLGYLRPPAREASRSKGAMAGEVA